MFSSFKGFFGSHVNSRFKLLMKQNILKVIKVSTH